MERSFASEWPALLVAKRHRQWRRLHRARGHEPPHFYKLLGTGAPWVEKQQTRNWPNCTDHHESAHQNDYTCTFRAKKWRGTTEKNFWRAPSVPSLLRRTGAPNFQIRSGATGHRSAGEWWFWRSWCTELEDQDGASSRHCTYRGQTKHKKMSKTSFSLETDRWVECHWLLASAGRSLQTQSQLRIHRPKLSAEITTTVSWDLAALSAQYAWHISWL